MHSELHSDHSSEHMQPREQSRSHMQTGRQADCICCHVEAHVMSFTDLKCLLNVLLRPAGRRFAMSEMFSGR